jgi:hypothetical protein
LKRSVILVSVAAVFGAFLMAGVAAALVLPAGTHKKCAVSRAKTHLVSAQTHTAKKTAKATCGAKKRSSKQVAKTKAAHPVTVHASTPATGTTSTTATTEDENDDAQCDEDDDDTTTMTTATTTTLPACDQGGQGDDNDNQGDDDQGGDD